MAEKGGGTLRRTNMEEMILEPGGIKTKVIFRGEWKFHSIGKTIPYPLARLHIPGRGGLRNGVGGERETKGGKNKPFRARKDSSNPIVTTKKFPFL